MTDAQAACERTVQELRVCRAEVNRLQATCEAQARQLAAFSEAARDALDYPSPESMERLSDVTSEWELTR